MAKGLLVAVFDFSTAHTDEFHDWYDLEHVPERQAVSGFEACERWISQDEPSVSVATYDLSAIDVLRGEDYKSIAYDNLSVWSKRVTAMAGLRLRFEGIQITPGDAPPADGAGALLLNAMNVAPEAEEDFNTWYDQEHLPALGAVPGTLSARRYRSDEAGGGTHQYVALYHLTSPEVTLSEAWKTAIDTPWSARVRPHMRDRIRILARRYVRSPEAATE
jgi:hypothetical protein